MRPSLPLHLLRMSLKQSTLGDGVMDTSTICLPAPRDVAHACVRLSARLPSSSLSHFSIPPANRQRGWKESDGAMELRPSHPSHQLFILVVCRFAVHSSSAKTEEQFSSFVLRLERTDKNSSSQKITQKYQTTEANVAADCSDQHQQTCGAHTKVLHSYNSCQKLAS